MGLSSLDLYQIEVRFSQVEALISRIIPHTAGSQENSISGRSNESKVEIPGRKIEKCPKFQNHENHDLGHVEGPLWWKNRRGLCAAHNALKNGAKHSPTGRRLGKTGGPTPIWAANPVFREFRGSIVNRFELQK